MTPEELKILIGQASQLRKTQNITLGQRIALYNIELAIANEEKVIKSKNANDSLTNTELRTSPVPVSGTISVDTSLLSTASNQTSGTQKTQIVDAGGEVATVTGGKLDVNATVTPSGTQDTNLIQVGGNTVDSNSGNKSAGTQRIVIATDQPQLTNALKTDGSAVTQPVSAASLPLPSGASTAAKQPALGTAGTASADVITVQGIASMTALKVDGSAVTQPVSGTFFQATQPVSAVALPLPSGAATEATLAAIDAGIPAALGQAAMAASMPVVIASNQSAVPISGTVTATPTGTQNVDVTANTIGLATGAKQDSQTALLTTIDGDTSNLDVALSTRLKPADTLTGVTTLTTVTNPVGIKGADGAAISSNANPVPVSDAGGSITVDGTVTANAGTNLNTSALNLETTQADIKTSVQLLDDTVATDGSATPTKGILIAGQDGTNAQTIKTDTNGELQVDVLTMPTVTVTATDLDIRNLVAATDAISVHGEVGILDQLDLTNSNPAAVAIVDANGDQITSFGGGTQYTEDAAAAANPIGTAVNLIRQDTPAGLTTTDGDNVAQRGTNFGAGFVQVLTSAGAFVDTFGGGTQYADGDATATPTGTVAMGTDGANVFAVHTDTAGDLQVDVLTMPTTTVQATNLDIRDLTFAVDKVDASGTVLGAGNNNIGDVDVASIAAGDNNIGNVDIASTVEPPTVTGSGSLTAVSQEVKLTLNGQANTTFQLTGSWTATVQFQASNDNSNWTTIYALRAGDDTISQSVVNSTNNDVYRCSTAGFGYVKCVCTAYTSGTIVITAISSSNTSGVFINFPLPAGTNYIGNVRLTDGTLNSSLVDETGSSAVDSVAIGGGTPHDSVNSGNPLYLGGEAIAHGTNPTAVAAADRTKLYANRAGIMFVIGGHPNVVTLKHTTITTAVTDAAIVTVAGGLKIVVTRVSVTLDNASTVFPTLLIGFGAANTPTTTGVLVAHGGVPAGGGITIGDGSGILGIGADGEDLRVTTTGNATGNGLQIVVSYYTIES